MKAFIQGFCLALAWGGAIAATICTFLSLFAQQFWGFALLEHPRPQYILLILPIGMGTLITRRWAQCFWLIPLLINLAIIQPHIFSVWPTIQAAQAPPSLVFVHFNLDRDHPKFDKAIEYLNTQKADFLLLQEVTPEWLHQLRANLTGYELVKAEPLINSHGSAIWRSQTLPSTLSLQSVELHHFPPFSPRPILSLHIDWHNQPITIVSLHTTRPRNAKTHTFQQVEFDAIAQWLQTQPNALILGDFNATPWSSTFHQFIKATHLQLATLNLLTQGTWPAHFPAMLQIPIDLCLHDDSLQISAYRVERSNGSDHRPILCAIQFQTHHETNNTKESPKKTMHCAKVAQNHLPRGFQEIVANSFGGV